MLETNIDDMTGEALSYTMERLLEAKALDVYFTPIIMKKNRPGIILSTICNLEDREKIKEIIFKETSSLGIREEILGRDILDRKVFNVEIYGQKINCKASFYNGKIIKIYPEYEDCKIVALNTGIAFEEIYEEAKRKIRELAWDTV